MKDYPFNTRTYYKSIQWLLQYFLYKARTLLKLIALSLAYWQQIRWQLRSYLWLTPPYFLTFAIMKNLFEIEITVNNGKWDINTKVMYLDCWDTSNTGFLANTICLKAKKWFTKITKEDFDAYVKNYLLL
jgi:hypothetical protein